MLTALLLARAGVRCRVLERKPGLSTHPKAMGVSRRTAEIYRGLGLLGRIAEGSLAMEGRWLSIWAKSLVGEELGRIAIAAARSPLTPCEALHCPQTWVEEVLLAAVLAEPLASVQFGVQVDSVIPGPDGVAAVLGNGGSLSAPWLIAADGAGSGIRHALEVGTVGPGDMGHFINVMFRANYGRRLADRPAVLYQVLSEKFFEAFVTVNGSDLWLMHHFLPPGESAENSSAERFVPIIREASGLPDVPVEVLSLSPWVMSPKVAAQFRMGRILLVGDAAARLSPAGGLGLNTGLQSAHNLAWKLAAVIRGEAGEGLLDSYDAERRSVALTTMRNTNRNADEMFATVTAGLNGDFARVRELVAGSRRGGSGLGQDLGVRYPEGAFLPDGTAAVEEADPVNDYTPSGRPGGRAPHLAIRRNGTVCSTLDLCGRGFNLFAGEDSPDWPAPPEVSVLRHGRDFQSEEFLAVYGIDPTGAVLVRPDGYVGCRFLKAPEDPSDSLRLAMDRILCRQPGPSRA